MSKRKLLIIAIVLVIAVVVVMFTYRFFFEFNNAKVKALIQEEADQYGEDSPKVYELIHENVQHILKSSDLTKNVRNFAKANDLPKEKVLVDTAITQARNNKYIK